MCIHAHVLAGHQIFKALMKIPSKNVIWVSQMRQMFVYYYHSCSISQTLKELCKNKLQELSLSRSWKAFSQSQAVFFRALES